MKSIKKYIFRSKKVIPNFFIGGLGVTYPTAASLATDLSISESNITGYIVDGSNNISCNIGIDLTTEITYLFYSSDITYIIDLDGRLKSTGSANMFHSNTNFSQAYLPELFERVGDSGGFNCWSNNSFDRYISLPKVLQLSNTAFNNETLVKVMYFSSLTNIYLQNLTRSNLSNLSSLNRFYAPLCNTASYNRIVDGTFAGLNSGCTFYLHPDLQTNSKSYGFITVNATNIGESVVVNGLTYTGVTTKTDNSEFIVTDGNLNGTAYNLSISIASDTRTGTLGDVTSYISSNTLSIIAKTSGSDMDAITLSTSYPSSYTLSGSTLSGGGLENGLVAYVRNTHSAIIKYVDDFTLPNSVTNLSASNITTTSVVLNFTPPTPNVNGTDGYEVWVDDGITLWQSVLPFDEIAGSGSTLGGLTSGTTYKIKMKTFDGFYNLSGFSNEIQITTL